jgi:[acyl-carrier-protein] S-malonyltransferase
MSKTAIVFPGQGSQYVGMGKDLFEGNETAKKIYQAADEIVGFPLSNVCFVGPEEELRSTKNTQPAIFLHSYILTQLKKNLVADMTGGHSLGEYTSLVYAGALSFEEGLKLVRLRGELMQRAGEENRGTMAAVLGLTPNVIADVCIKISKEIGIVQPANINSPGQVVISGSIDGIREAMTALKMRGAKVVKELSVGGAFHSPLMSSAQEGLSKALDAATIKDSNIPVYSNVTGNAETKGDRFRALLKEQLTSPVRWEAIINAMSADGAISFIEIGPGKVLQGLIKRTNASATVTGIEKLDEVLL